MTLLITLLFGMTIFIGTLIILITKDNKKIAELSISIAFSVLFLLIFLEVIPHCLEHLDYFSMIVQTMPGVASRIIRDGLRFGQAKSLPSAYECGKKLQECMKVWISALGPLSHYIAPIDATDPLPLVVGAQDGRIAFSWRKGKMNSSVTTMSIRELVHTQGACQIRGVPAQSTWPWIITFEYLSDKLKKALTSLGD